METAAFYPRNLSEWNIKIYRENSKDSSDRKKNETYCSLLYHVFPFTSSAVLSISLYNFSYKRMIRWWALYRDLAQVSLLHERDFITQLHVLGSNLSVIHHQCLMCSFNRHYQYTNISQIQIFQRDPFTSLFPFILNIVQNLRLYMQMSLNYILLSYMNVMLM